MTGPAAGVLSREPQGVAFTNHHLRWGKLSSEAAALAVSLPFLYVNLSKTYLLVTKLDLRRIILHGCVFLFWGDYMCLHCVFPGNISHSADQRDDNGESGVDQVLLSLPSS